MRIMEHRERLGLSQEKLARELDVSFQTVNSWENGRSVPRPIRLLMLAEIFGCDVDEIQLGE